MRYYGVQNEVKSYLNRLQSEDGIEVSLSTVKTLNDRVEALKKSGVWSQYGLGFNDGDADRYFQRATVRDAIGRFEVCLFVRGMKTLGLWQNMVSWPMRSYQNAGTGSTAYSLGGLGTFDGTLVNSPPWSVDGIVTSDGGGIPYKGSPANYIETNITLTNYSTRSMFAVGREIVATTENSTSLIMVAGYERARYMIYGDFFSGMSLSLSFRNESASVGYLQTNVNDRLKVLGVANFGTSFHSTAAIFNARSLSRYEDGVLAGSDGPRGAWSDAISDPGVLRFGYRTESGAACTDDQVITFVCDMRVALTPQQSAILHPLYKLTLGSSLALP